MEPVPKTLYLLNHLMWLMAREDYIKLCHHESFKIYRFCVCFPQGHRHAAHLACMFIADQSYVL
jgi:hypothetical protein